MGDTVKHPNGAREARTPLEKRVRKGLLAIDDVHEGEAIFGDRDRTTAYFVDAKQMANFVDENSLAIRLSRKKISELRAELKADENVDLPRSGGDWMGVSFSTRADADRAIELASIAAAVYRPDGRPARLPPTGADLTRRQRFH